MNLPNNSGPVIPPSAVPTAKKNGMIGMKPPMAVRTVTVTVTRFSVGDRAVTCQTRS
jgi:hypothetical protein